MPHDAALLRKPRWATTMDASFLAASRMFADGLERGPSASRFELGRDLALTVADLAGASTPNPSMVVASCCRTGVIDQRGVDRLVGLAQALIAAGAVSAIATLAEEFICDLLAAMAGGRPRSRTSVTTR
jgi:hypothetical protein